MEIDSREEFNIYLKTLGYIKAKPNQYEFYARTFDFMKGDKKFLINPAGMGLGKTIPTTIIINEFLTGYDIVFIANPTTPLKYVWMGNIHEVGLLNKTAIWPSKRDVCIYKQLFKDREFPLSKCNDDCEYRISCQSHDTYTHGCREDYENYMSLGKKATPLNYYNELINKKEINLKDYLTNNETLPFNCLYAPTRMGLRDLYIKGTRKIIVGDYNGFLMQKMFKDVTNIELGVFNSLLIIDEGHLINARARGHYSNAIYLNRGLNNLSEELDTYKEKLSHPSFERISFFIKKITQLIPILDEKSNHGRIDYTYINLKRDLINEDALLIEIIDSLKSLDSIINKDKDKEGQKSAALDFNEYLESLKNNSHKSEYFCSLKKTTYYKKKDLRLDVMCIDPSKNLKRMFANWNKVIINTGTLSKNKNIVLSEIGINEKDCVYSNLLKSYNLSNYTFIHNSGRFNSQNRNRTYESNLTHLSEVLNKMSGKTIMFIQSKQDAILLERLLKLNKFSIINFCKNEEDEEISPEEFELLKNEFVNYSGKCIGIININGRVEGHNFTDDQSIPQVKNVIVYGFPLPYPGDLMKAREKWYIKSGLGETEDEILNHIYLNEAIQKIQQSCYRCKRDDKQNPIIILWDERFTDNEIFLYKEDKIWRRIKKDFNIFNSLPEDFKQNIGNYNELIKFIEKREDGRNNNIH